MISGSLSKTGKRDSTIDGATGEMGTPISLAPSSISDAVLR